MSLLNTYTQANSGTPYYALVGDAEPGPPGPPGEAATITVGGTATLAPGSDATVVNTGTANAAVLQFGIPAGEQGEPGAPGAAATIAVGATSTLAAGSPATVTNVGTGSAAVFNFGIPAGPQGSAADAATWSTFPATQDVDLATHDITNAGTITCETIAAGTVETPVGASVSLGSALKPAATVDIVASEVSILHLDPLTQALVRSTGGMRVEAQNGDLDVIGDDVNISSTGSTNVLNITSLAGIQNTAGGFFNVTAGGGMGIQAGGLISITSTGQINIGSSNTLGATTSIEKLDINDSIVSKVAGASDLQINNVKSLTNAGDATNTLTVEATNAPLTVRGAQTNITSVSNGNVVIAPQGTGQTIIGTGTVASAITVDATGVATFSSSPICAAVPASNSQLINKAYADTKLPSGIDITLTHSIAAPAATAATAGPFLYVPSAAGPPTGTPPLVAGAVPLYVETGGSGKLWAYWGGVWSAI